MFRNCQLQIQTKIRFFIVNLKTMLTGRFFLFLFIFNISSLTMGQTVDFVDIKMKILHECRFIPTASRPREGSYEITYIEGKFVFMRLYQVNEIEEYLTYSGGFMYSIMSNCIKEKTLLYNQTEIIDEMWVLTDLQNYWKPSVVHANSKNDFGLQKEVTWQIMVYPFMGVVAYAGSGVFTPSCDLTFLR